MQFFASCKKNAGGGSNPAITNSGITVTTFAGGGPPSFLGNGGIIDGDDTSARFNFPTAIAFDGGGNMYVCDENDYSIREISGGNVFTLLRNSPYFNLPDGVAVDSKGNIYVLNIYANFILGITGGSVGVLAGVGNPGYLNGKGNAMFNMPSAIAMNAHGAIYTSPNKTTSARSPRTRRQAHLQAAPSPAIPVIIRTAPIRQPDLRTPQR